MKSISAHFERFFLAHTLQQADHMRIHAILLFLVISQIGYSQEKKNSFEEYPFQVVFAENATLNDGHTLIGRYDYIKKDTQIQLDSGFLILMHHSEKLFEVSGDSIIDVSELLKEMPDYLKLNQIERPEISFFSKFRNKNSTGASYRCVGYFYTFYGFENSVIRINSNQLLQLHWNNAQESDVHDYTITIRNITDSLLDLQVVKEATFLLDPTKYEPRPELLIVQVANNIKKDRLSEPVGIWLEDTKTVYIPKWDQLSRPIDQLQAWYYLTSRDNYFQAREYLDRLNVKSNHPFYQNLIEIWTKQ